MNKRILSHGALFLVALIYGANYSIAKIVMDEESFSPFALLGFRLLTGFLIFSIFFWALSPEKIHRKDAGLILLCGLTGVGINMALFLYGLDNTNPINASLVMTLTPILVLVFSYIILNQRITIRNTVGICVALCGTIYLVYKPEFGFSLDRMKGDIAIFLNGSSYALYLVLLKKLVPKYKPITILMLVFSVGFLVFFPFTIPQISIIEWNTFDRSVYLSLAFVLIGTTCFTYLLNVFALQYVKSSTAGVYIYLQPLLATFFAILLAKDVLNVKIVICTVLIFTGLYLVSSKK